MVIINNSFSFILTIFILLDLKQCAVYLPFKISYSYENKQDFNSTDVLNYWKSPKINSELMIGSPPQKMCVSFVSNIYELNLFQNNCDCEGSSYNKESSESYFFLKNINYMYNKILNCSIINETLYLYKDQEQKNKLTFEGMNIIYSDNKKEEFKPDRDKQTQYEYHSNTCLNIGFLGQLDISFGYDLNLNFVRQLKNYQKNKNSFATSYDWTFKFTSAEEGFLIIGQKPHEFDNNNYKEEQYLTAGSKNNRYTHEWFLEVDSIYYTGIRENNNSAYNSSFYDDSSIKLDINYGLIEGTKNYEENIKKDFFNKLFEGKHCFFDQINEYRFYYCNKDAFNYIKKYFPTLKFCFKQHGMCFEFTYDDLFKEKNDKLFFLIYFNDKNSFSRYTIGLILLKKYLITFNYDTKLIGFYNKNIPINSTETGNENENNKSYGFFLYFIIIVLFILFLIIGFLLGKKIYENTRKKRANELLDDDYEYKSGTIDNKNIN